MLEGFEPSLPAFTASILPLDHSNTLLFHPARLLWLWWLSTALTVAAVPALSTLSKMAEEGGIEPLPAKPVTCFPNKRQDHLIYIFHKLALKSGFEPLRSLEPFCFTSKSDFSKFVYSRIILVDRMGLEPIKSILQGSTVPLYTAHKIGGGRGNRTLLVKVLARHLRNPFTAPILKIPM